MVKTVGRIGRTFGRAVTLYDDHLLLPSNGCVTLGDDALPGGPSLSPTCLNINSRDDVALCMANHRSLGVRVMRLSVAVSGNLDIATESAGNPGEA